MSWILWLDDIRVPYYVIHGKKKMGPFLKDFEHTDLPTDLSKVFWAKSGAEAMALTEEFGAPDFMYLDHDLGVTETTMDYLKYLTEKTDSPPNYYIISANQIGSENIRSFMTSWKKSTKI